MSGARFFEPEELVGALVVDSEALVYGRVGGVRFSEDGAFLQVYVPVRARERVVDAARLAELLRGRGVEGSEGWPLELLVRRAREEGLEIPYVEAEREVKLLKGEVRVEEVALIDAQEVENPSTGALERVAVVLLSTPREAEYRGRKLPPPVPPPVEDAFRGKLCVSASGGVLGYVEGIVVGAGVLGLRVCRRRGAPTVNWAAFLARVREAGEERLYRELSERLHPLRKPILSGPEVEEARSLLKSLGARLLKAFDESVQRGGGAVYVDVPWPSIRAARDVVLVE